MLIKVDSSRAPHAPLPLPIAFVGTSFLLTPVTYGCNKIYRICSPRTAIDLANNTQSQQSLAPSTSDLTAQPSNLHNENSVSTAANSDPRLTPAGPSTLSAGRINSSSRPAKRRRSPTHSHSPCTDPQCFRRRSQSPQPLVKRRRAAGEIMIPGTETNERSSSPSATLRNDLGPCPAGLSNGHGKAANGASYVEGDSNGSHDIFANGDNISNPRINMNPWFGHDREEVTRILIQALSDMGYDGAAGALSTESGYELEGPAVAAFRNAVLQGDWVRAEILLFGSEDFDGQNGAISDGFHRNSKSQRRLSKQSTNGAHQNHRLALAERANKNEMLFWVRQQKYLELLESRNLAGALMVLRQELTPLNQDTHRLHVLSSFMMCQSAEDLMHQARWDGAAGLSRGFLLSELSKSISPSIMVPEHRLAVLLNRVKDDWVSNCLYHNTSLPPSLFTDHVCKSDDFPLDTAAELCDHSDEVWFLQYSHDGSRLATASKDNTVIIYETVNYKIIHKLLDHDSGVCYVAWSPDDTKIITCTESQDHCARVWDTQVGSCILTLDHFNYAVTTAAWAPGGETFVIGSQDSKSALCLWNLRGEQEYIWKEDNLRIYDLSISPDGERLVVLLESRIMVYNFVTKEKLQEISMGEVKLTSVNISKNSQCMLVSMNDNKTQLINIHTSEVLQSFEGHVQKDWVIRSNFGGANETHVVSGSEDSCIYIWRITGQLVEALNAHRSKCVNAVAWHPRDPSVFASVGDDHRLRIWTRAKKLNNVPYAASNGHSL